MVYGLGEGVSSETASEFQIYAVDENGNPGLTGEVRIKRADSTISAYKVGADGIVIGTMKPDGTLNVEQMKELIEEAKGMSVTLHRAFDMCKNPFMALEEARKLGINTILTSGQKNTCIDGVELLKELVEKAQGETEILVGGGVDASVLPVLAEKTKAKAYHMSGKISMESEMRYRKQDVSMGIASVSEYEIWRTSEKRVREARKILDEL